MNDMGWVEWLRIGLLILLPVVLAHNLYVQWLYWRAGRRFVFREIIVTLAIIAGFVAVVTQKGS